MTRKKVKLAYITNDSSRKATFKKRKKGLIKKVSELSTLCGVNACAIIYSPYESHPEVWPSPMGVQRVLSDFKQMPEMEQSKKMVNQESFLRQRINKATDQLKKQRKDNREKEMTHVMFQSLTGKSLENLNMIDLNDLGWLAEQHLKEISRRKETLRKNSGQSYPPGTSTPKEEVPGASVGAGTSSGSGVGAEIATDDRHHHYHHQIADNASLQRQQWMMEMMNQQEHMGFTGEEMMLPFGETNHHINPTGLGNQIHISLE